MHKAIVLAAGRGTRMGPLTEDIPKPMLPVAGKPLLEHILGGLAEAGITSVLLVVGYRRDLIEKHFASWPVRIEYRVQEKLEGTARAVALGRDFAAGEPCLVTFGDIVCRPGDYRGMVDAFRPGVAAVVGARWVDDPWQGAAVYADGGEVTRIVEKPARGTSTTNWNSAGLYVFAPEIFDYLDRVGVSSRGEYELTSAVEALIADRKRLVLYGVKGDWRDVGRPEDLPEVEKWL
jgi:UDP-N-acetylglucosamine diphosphorylase / glucose-1-phosphate thymidylyltransferase / UDP-N-acetylgalactosamine diphosphorylase / glucosamine-1-phosphate N-acetyltransferase / galactosamine-1-phosphate N-acetyltransferase